MYTYNHIHQEEESVSPLACYKYHYSQLHFAWPAWGVVFQVGIHWSHLKANQLIRDPPCDSYEPCQESKGRRLQQLVKKKSCPCVCTCIYIYKNNHVYIIIYMGQRSNPPDHGHGSAIVLSPCGVVGGCGAGCVVRGGVVYV